MWDRTMGQTMEDLFFLQKDRDMIEQRRKMQQMQETRANLAKVSGITNEALLGKLLALDIRPETLATLFAVPLVEVAWADGELQQRERDQLLKYAEQAGMRQKGLDPKIMAGWLRSRPDPALLDAWSHYVQALWRELGPAERQSLKTEVMQDARSVAQAAGGIMGIGSISSAEQAMLNKLEAAFSEPA